MAANEHLNEQQFMSVQHLMNNVPAGESAAGLPLGKDPEILQVKRDGISGAAQWNPDGVAAVRGSIRDGSVEPLYLNNGRLDNGHHRLVMAHDMGVERLPVTSDPERANGEKFGGVF